MQSLSPATLIGFEQLLRYVADEALLHCALSLAAQCIVIGPICDSGGCNGRAGGVRVRTLQQPARAVFASL